jgi:anti-anti-sigma regulatory factor
MKVKIDTKEKFHVITLQEEHFSAIMTEDVSKLLLSYLTADVKNVVLKFGAVKEIDLQAAEELLALQQTFYDNNCSFVICELQPAVEKFLDKNEWLEMMNVTPTESEAWDIVQLEEIERELFN